MLLSEAPLLFETFAFLIAYAIAVKWVPFDRLARHLGTARARGATVPTFDPDPAHLDAARRVSWAIGAIDRRTRRAFVCLPQALTAARLLRARKVPHTLVLGTRFGNEPTHLTAHAWVLVGRRLVTGGSTIARYRPVAAFDHRTRS